MLRFCNEKRYLSPLMMQLPIRDSILKLSYSIVGHRFYFLFLLELIKFHIIHVQLGNPVLEYATDFNSRAEYLWSHGLISDTTYKMFNSVCNYSRYVSEYYRDAVSPTCLRVINQVNAETSNFVDKYDVTLDVCISSVLSQSKVLNPKPQVSNKK